LLDEFGERVDRTQGRLDRAMKRVAYIIKQNEGENFILTLLYIFI